MAAARIVGCAGAREGPAEAVAREAVEAAKGWLAADVPVDEHLADQLLLPMALGRIRAESTGENSLIPFFMILTSLGAPPLDPHPVF